jgi:hypothetical protein
MKSGSLGDQATPTLAVHPHKNAWVGLGAVLALAPLCAFAQTSQSARTLQREHDTQQGHGEVGNAQDPGAAQEYLEQTKAKATATRAPAPRGSQ